MDTLHVTHFHSRYRLPAAMRDEQQRLDRLFMDSVQTLLAAALERAGVPVHEEIVIRDLHAVTRLRASHTDALLAEMWSVSLAEAIATATRTPGSGVVRYGSRHRALVDVLVSVARDDLTRAWAWRQLDLWTAPDGIRGAAAVEEAVGALIRQGAAAPAVLRAVAQNGSLGILLTRADPAAWEPAARAALAAVGAADSSARSNESVRDANDAARIVRDSVILQAVAAVTAPLRTALARALAAFGALEIDPAVLVTDPARAPRLIDAIVARLADAAAPATAPTQKTPAKARADLSRPMPAASSETPAGLREPSDDANADSLLADGRCRGRTHAGGLLYLLDLVGALDLPAEIVASPVFAQRSVRWVLHRLALALVPLAPNDPAALAFAGLQPTSDPPAEDAPDVEDAEATAITVLRNRVVVALRQQLNQREGSAERWLAFVCRRQAEIVADPGWIEVHFSLDEVSTEIRRVGLDLDPGWLPWLGVVLRFVYG